MPRRLSALSCAIAPTPPELASRAEHELAAQPYLPDPDEPIPYSVTGLGRRELAMLALFGPWPSVAQTCANQPLLDASAA